MFCMSVLPPCICIYTKCVLGPLELEVEMLVNDHFLCRELNLDPPQEQQVLLTSDPFSDPLCSPLSQMLEFKFWWTVKKKLPRVADAVVQVRRWPSIPVPLHSVSSTLSHRIVQAYSCIVSGHYLASWLVLARRCPSGLCHILSQDKKAPVVLFWLRNKMKVLVDKSENGSL